MAAHSVMEEEPVKLGSLANGDLFLVHHSIPSFFAFSIHGD